MKVLKQETKTAHYKLQIVDVAFYHDWLDKDLKNKPIKCSIKSKLAIKIGNEIIEKIISNTVFMNPEEPIYKEILLHSKHIILT